MTKKQFAATSLLASIPAIGLIVVLFPAALGGADFGIAMWGLWGATLVAAIVTSGMPVAVWLLIPSEDAVATAEPEELSSDTDAGVEEEEDLEADEVEDSRSFELEDEGEINEFAEDEDIDGDEDFEVEDDYNAAETEVASSGELADDFDDDEDFEIGEDFEDEFDDFDDDEDFV